MSYIKNYISKFKNVNIIVKASLWFFVVTIIDKAISLITQPIINRIFSVQEVGANAIYISWYGIFNIFATFYLFCGVLEVYLTKEKDNSKVITASLSSLSLIISTIFTLIIVVFNKKISIILDLPPIYLIVMCITIIGESFIQFWSVSKRFKYEYKNFAYLTVLLFLSKSILSVFLAYVWESDRVLGRIVGICIPTILVGAILFIRNLNQINLKKIFSYWKIGLKFNIPLLPHYLSSILLSSSDRVMIEKLSSLSDTGLYSVAYTYASMALIVFSAINNAYNPYSLKLIKEGKFKGLASSTRIMVFVSIVFSLLLMLIAPEGMILLGGKKYLDALNIIPILIVGIFLSSFYFIFSNIEFVFAKTKMIFLVTFLGASINIILNYWLIPIYGYYAAGYTTFLGYLVIAIAHYYISKKIIKEDIYNIKIIILYLLIFFILSICCLYLYKLNAIFRYIIIIILSFLSFIYCKKQLKFNSVVDDNNFTKCK